MRALVKEPEVCSGIWVPFVPGEMRMARNVVPIDAGGWKTGALVPRSGIYMVRHSQHRLPQEVTLLQGQEFPRCAGCESPVFFRMRRELPDAGTWLRFHIHLYQLPVLDEAKRAG